jgi:FdhE protein
VYLERRRRRSAVADLTSLLDMRLAQEAYQRPAPNLLLAPGDE